MFPQDSHLHPPKQIRQTDHRSVKTVILEPHRQFYYPDDLRYANAMLPTVPGNGGYVSMGAGMVLYVDNNCWDRGNTALAGPVKQFFRNMMGNRGSVKQTP